MINFILSLQLLLTGQSNACYLSPYIPIPHILVCSPGQSITSWEQQPGNVMHQMVTEVMPSINWNVVVWWQGESDASMTVEEYASRFLEILTRLAVNPDGTIKPIMIVEIASKVGREHITWVHQYFATHPMIAWIPTNDLPRLNSSDHFTPSGYNEVVNRLSACWASECWRD